MKEKMEKPPLGLRPRSILRRQRMGEILDAMCRYFAAEKQIPPEWVDEFENWNLEAQSNAISNRLEELIKKHQMKGSQVQDDVSEAFVMQTVSFPKIEPALPSKPKRKYTRRAKAEGKSPRLKIKGEKKARKPRSAAEADRYIREQE